MLTRLRSAADRHYARLMLLPGALVMVLLLGYPIVLNVYYSVTNRNLQFPGVEWVGLEQYRSVLTDATFWLAARNSVIWTATTVAGQLVLGLSAALIAERFSRSAISPAVRALLIVPWMFSPVVLAAVWRLLLDPLNGIANAGLIFLGLVDAPVAFFGSSETALPSAIVMGIWYGYPFMFVAFLAGLASVSDDLLDASAVDGAGYWRQVWHVALPALRSIVGTLVVLRTIWMMNNFGFIFLSTGGGPRDSSLTLPVYAFRVGWQRFDVARMGAIAVLMTCALAVLVVILMKLVPIEQE